ncbi:hypothetical protein GJ629_14405 [Halapricum sp. CBA1109]|uniref:hypothetical protein n=1 Tax=Halapricum sp. CBA1109 TaxID=2668068 RepID=UPI0013BC09E1|nr:hypothetical protein [Halapricum sp. CBA1109]MUV90936.1 hypothetical protein [Halapricum sp. CBA1109]
MPNGRNAGVSTASVADHSVIVPGSSAVTGFSGPAAPRTRSTVADVTDTGRVVSKSTPSARSPVPAGTRVPAAAASAGESETTAVAGVGGSGEQSKSARAASRVSAGTRPSW